MITPTGDPGAPGRSAGAETCASCGAHRPGPYCAACGQRARPRLTTPGLLREAVGQVSDLDRGFLRTVIDLYRRPGGLTRDYLRGVTRPYTHPLKFAVVIAALTTVVMLALDFYDPERYRIIDYETGGPLDDQLVAANAFYVRYLNLFLLLIIPLAAGATWTVFRRERLTYAEHFVFIAYAFGAATIVATLVAVPAYYLAGAQYTGRVTSATSWVATAFVYFLWAAFDFFGGGRLRRIALSAVVAVPVVLVYLLLTGALLLAYAWAQVYLL